MAAVNWCASLGCPNRSSDMTFVDGLCLLCFYYVKYNGVGVKGTYACWGQLTTEEAMDWIL